tara:strand:+ start:58004 stop:58567 length:564 start_codon:yes stop_codon:yes gene_type:complete
MEGFVSNQHIFPAVLVFISFNFAACEVPIEKVEQASVATETEYQLKLNNKHNLFDTSLEDLQEYLVIRGQSKVFMKICHLPKGNPDNYQSLTLPMEAIAAHLRHGLEHGVKDYLGECEPVVVEVPTDTSEDNSSGETASDPENDSSGEHGNESGSGDEQLPIWCEIDLDSECDGILDDSGELYIVIQ